jgi:hypothetical protein
MMRIKQHAIVLTALLTGASAALAQGETPRPAPTAKPAAPPPAAAPTTRTLFRFDCADRRSLEAAGDSELVKQLVAAAQVQSSQKFGDRGVLAELNGDGSPELFVPVGCGVTCNCDWLIVDTKAHRQLGIVNACMVHVKPPESGWAELVTYKQLSNNDGELASYRMHEGAYTKLSLGHASWTQAAPFLGAETWETGCK